MSNACLTFLDQEGPNGFCCKKTSDATRRILNVLECFLCWKNMNALSASIDAEKALDRVHWLYMSVVMESFGFRGPILSTILALYSNPSTQVNASGLLSKPFGLSNGTWQGCPLSPMIFNLMIEPLAKAIRSNPLITGFKFQDSTHKIKRFTDDIIILLTNPDCSLPQAFWILTEFSYIS